MKRPILIATWVAILLSLIYIYFFHREVFVHIFQYPGAGSPYVNTPEGSW